MRGYSGAAGQALCEYDEVGDVNAEAAADAADAAEEAADGARQGGYSEQAFKPRSEHDLPSG